MLYADGVRQGDGRTLLELEDLARSYSHPCIMDIKIGHRTWYPQADPAYIERCRAKDAATTQAALGFKICGMQVYRHGQGGYWRASKRWCKTLPEVLVDKALLSFVHNEHGLKPSDVYGGAGGAVAQLEDLAAWFRLQREFRFYSASVLILYEGDASDAGGAAVRVRLVDFAHTFQTDERGKGDDNFLAGLLSLTARLNGVSRIETADTLM
jgi:1D-myo-inositol-tetrakisphosphate 5-kinase/inositol-polyphosphate multikinase